MPLTIRTSGLVLAEHEFAVPLDHARPEQSQLTVFAREVAAPDGLDRPFLLFLQGGPGHEASRPTAHGPSWLSRALQDFRVLLLDQRGTGRSSPVGVLPGMSPHEQADYLTHFRADSIVADAESIRAQLGVEQWSVLGQSFGGFCTLTYLCVAPHALREALFTGGLPPLARHPDEVYRATYATMLERNRRYYRRYPADADRVRALQSWLEAEDVRLPSGGRLTPRLLRQIGHMLGTSDGAEQLHYILELDPTGPAFLPDVEAALPFPPRNPLYSVVHESSYADGFATRWSAERMLPVEFAADTALFTGEHVYPWNFTDCPALTPLRAVADILAHHEWPRLYDADRLARCEVPCAAAIYAEDAYVERTFSEETARLIPNMRPWITNEYEHNGLRADGGRIVDRLLALARGRT